MPSNIKWFTVVILALAVGMTGCGKKRKDVGAESLDGASDADTAPVDGASNMAEGLPVIDDSKPFDDSPKAPAPELKGSGDMATYTVRAGDTLMKIAFTLYGDIASWKNLYNWNKETLKRASQLEKGTQLKYEKPSSEAVIEKNGDPYMIKHGDTLASIADDVYAKRSKWKKIWANNKGLIHNPNRIYAGFYLYYQITEQEKAQAEAIKAKRGGAAPIGDAPPAGAAPASAASLPSPAAAPDPAANGANAGKGALKPGKLSALPAPRAPASTGLPAPAAAK